MRNIFLICLLVISISGIAQPIVTRASGSNTVADIRHQATLNSFLPRYNDTTAANLQLGIDSAGARIYTRNPQAIWYRAANPKRWVRSVDVENLSQLIDSSVISNISILNDSTLLLCTGAGACDTISISTNITNINTVSFLNDSSVVVCAYDTSTVTSVCDTITIGRQPIAYVFQNALVQSGNLVEFGGGLIHPTTINNWNSPLTWNSYQIYDYAWRHTNALFYQLGTGLDSWQGRGEYINCCGDINGNYVINNVTLGIDYMGGAYSKNDPTYGYIQGYMGDSVKGYTFGTNGTGYGSYGFVVNDYNAKTVKLLLHTTDTVNNNAFTFYGAPQSTANTSNEAYKIINGNGIGDYKLVDFNTDKSIRFYGYTNTRHDGAPTNVLYTDASGNLKSDTLIGGNVTILNDTTLIICSFGTNLCDTIYTTTGGISGITADNGLTANSPTNVQLGSTSPTGSPFTADRYVYVSTHNLDFLGTGSSSTVAIQNQNVTSGVGLDVTSDNGIGATIGTSNGTFGALISASPTSTNTIQGLLKVSRAVAGGTAANGVGGSIDYYLQHANGQADLSNQLISKWTDVTDATRVSQFYVTGVNSGVTQTLQTLDGNGQLTLNQYTTSNFNGGSANDSVLVITSAGVVKKRSQSAVGITGITADNGLTANTSTNVQLGGSFLQNTTIDASTYKLTINGTGNDILVLDASGGGDFSNALDAIDSSFSPTITSRNKGFSSAIFANNTYSGGGTALKAQSTAGFPIEALALGTTFSGSFTVFNSATNSIKNILSLSSQTSGTAANGIGGALEFDLEVVGGSSYEANKLVSKWTDATDATRTSQFSITGVNSGATETWLSLVPGYQIVNNGADTLATRDYARGFGGSSVTVAVDLTDAATINTDASAGFVGGATYRVTLGGNRTIANPTNLTDGQRVVYELHQDVIGGRSVSWDTMFTWSTDLPTPTLSTTANYIDQISFTYNDTDGKLYVSGINLGIH